MGANRGLWSYQLSLLVGSDYRYQEREWWGHWRLVDLENEATLSLTSLQFSSRQGHDRRVPTDELQLHQNKPSKNHWFLVCCEREKPKKHEKSAKIVVGVNVEMWKVGKM